MRAQENALKGLTPAAGPRWDTAWKRSAGDRTPRGRAVRLIFQVLDGKSIPPFSRIERQGYREPVRENSRPMSERKYTGVYVYNRTAAVAGETTTTPQAA